MTTNQIYSNTVYYPNTNTIYATGVNPAMFGPASLFSITDSGKELVRINFDGSVTWADGIQIDAAAAALSRSLGQSAEIRAGITHGVKLRMRDSVFETLIGIARDKGSLSADDLTYLLESSKIIEKLKGSTD